MWYIEVLIMKLIQYSAIWTCWLANSNQKSVTMNTRRTVKKQCRKRLYSPTLSSTYIIIRYYYKCTEYFARSKPLKYFRVFVTLFLIITNSIFNLHLFERYVNIIEGPNIYSVQLFIPYIDNQLSVIACSCLIS